MSDYTFSTNHPVANNQQLSTTLTEVIATITLFVLPYVMLLAIKGF